MTSIPFADLASPFKWAPPFEYTAPAFGASVVAFKILVIAPSIAFVSMCVTSRGNRDQGAAPQPGDEPAADLPPTPTGETTPDDGKTPGGDDLPPASPATVANSTLSG
jgi:hypothetical protein